MGTKYTSQSATGYNASPPPDDGSTNPNNKTTWAGVKTKLADVLKTFIEAVNTAILAWSDFATTAVVANYTTVAGDNGRTLECSGSFTLKLRDAAAAGADYVVTVKNAGTGLVTVALETATDTLDGTVNGTATVRPNAARSFRTNAAANGHLSIDGQTSNALTDAISGGKVQLQFVSTTQIKLVPWNGTALFVNGYLRSIPVAGITASNTGVFVEGTGGQNLAANTVYYVYVFDNSGTLTIDFSQTAHATDATYGHEIKSGAATRSLVGVVRTNASSQFQAKPLLRSWFNDHNAEATASVNSGTASAFPVELGAGGSRGTMLVWGGETVDAEWIGNITATGGAVTVQAAIGIDAGTAHADSSSLQFDTSAANLQNMIGALSVSTGLSEGYHDFRMLGGRTAGTSTGLTYNGKLRVVSQR